MSDETLAKRREPAELDRDVFDEEIGEEIFRHGDRHQRHDIHEPVEDAALPDRRQQSEADRQRHGDDRRISRQEHRVGEARRDLLQDVAPVGERLAEIAVQRAKQPLEETNIGGLVEPEIEPHLGERLGRGGVLQNGGGEVARQDLRPDEDQHRRGEQGEDSEAETVEDELQHGRPSPPRSGLRPQGRGAGCARAPAPFLIAPSITTSARRPP